MLTDNIADLLTRIRNAYLRGIENIEVPHTKMNEAVLNVLKENNFISNVKIFKYEGKKFKGINVELKYDDNTPVLSHISRVSKPSLRRYVKAEDIEKVLGGLGIYVISTPRGVLSSKEARKRKLGGEIICKAY